MKKRAVIIATAATAFSIASAPSTFAGQAAVSASSCSALDISCKTKNSTLSGNEDSCGSLDIACKIQEER